MTADAVLLDLLARVAANSGNQTFISAHDLNDFVKILNAH
jgi:hypothetical protein